MATHVHVGQCGAQLGFEFWKLANQTYSPEINTSPTSGPLPTLNESCSQLFHSKGTCKAIWIDTEPKVLNTVLKNRFATKEQILFEQSGRGNNFAYGYNGSKNICEMSMEQIRKEAEQNDRFQGTILWHSVGGGTGSGLGTKIAETLRDTYAKGNILTISILPDLTTESPLLNYNTLFSTSCLSDIVDGQILFKNNDVLSSMNYLLNGKGNRTSGNITNMFQMEDINSYIARTLSDVLFPQDIIDTDFYTAHLDKVSRKPFDLGSFLSTLCPIWDLKLLNIYSSCPAMPRKRNTEAREWRSVLDTFVNIVPKFDDTRQRIKTISTYTYLNKKKHVVKISSTKSSKRKSNNIIRRKKKNNNKKIDKTYDELLPKLAKIYKYTSWYPDNMMMKFHNISRSYGKPASGDNVSIACCSNSSKNTTTLRRLNYSCRNMYNAKAYVHWYSRYGIENTDFEIAMDKIETIVQSYNSVCV